MGSTFHNLEITVLSAENLKLDSKSIKKDAFVVIRVDDSANNSKSTKADHEGGSYPCWNQMLEINMPMQAHFITLEAQCKIGSVNRVIGTAKVPASDFLGGYIPKNYLNFLSYRLRDVRGEKNGIINISLKVKEFADDLAILRKNSPLFISSTSSPPPPWGVPVNQNNNFYDHGRVVTGVPAVWCASRA